MTITCLTTRMKDCLESWEEAFIYWSTKYDNAEKSDEHVIIIGTGELYTDCLLHDLWNMFPKLKLKMQQVLHFEHVKNQVKWFVIIIHKIVNEITMICGWLNTYDIEKTIANS